MKIDYFHTDTMMILDNVTYRISRITENNQCILEKLDNLSLVQKSKDELLRLYQAGNLAFRSDITHNQTNQNMVHPDNNRIFHEYYCYIQAAQRKLGNKPTTVGLQEIIDLESSEKTANHKKPSAITLYRWWSKWVNSGYDSNAFQNKKRGPIFSTSFNNPVVKRIFDEVVDTVYLTRQNNSIKKTYDTFRFLILENNKKSIKTIKCPSRSQFYEKINRLDKELVISSRKGKRIAQQYFRQTGLGVAVAHILERVEVDHTTLDIMVFNENTKQVDGRPTLTALIDVYSRMILGIEIGFEPPSQLSVMRALKNSILPKNIKREEKLNKHDWPAYGIPITLVCDNGMEFHAKDLRRMCAELNIELIFCPKQQPHYKGHIERFMGTLNRQVCHLIQGTTFSNITMRGDYNSIDSATITLSELKQLIYQWLITDYIQSPHKGIGTIPIKKWQEGLSILPPRLPESAEYLNFILTIEFERLLSHEGIQFEHLFYNSHEIKALRILYGDQRKIKCRYDSENLGYIWVQEPQKKYYIKIPCVQFEYAKNTSLFQHKQVLQEKNQIRKNSHNESELLTSRSALYAKIQSINKKQPIKKRTSARLFNEQNISFLSDTKKESTIEHNINLTDFFFDEDDEFEVVYNDKDE